MSLKYRLIAWLTLLTLLVWAAMSLVLYQLAARELGEVFDAQLAQSARALVALVSSTANQDRMEHLQEVLQRLDPKELPRTHAQVEAGEEAPGAYERLFAYQILGADGRLRLRSGTAPETPFATHTGGFSEVQASGQRWRLFSLADAASGLVVHVGEQAEIREELAEYTIECVSPPVLVTIAGLVLGVWWVVTLALRPLLGLVGEIKTREPQDLRPLPLEPAPAEVAPLVDALNALLLRLEGAMERERAFTGDAAHELRTPLAGLRVQAQVALRATADADRQGALHRIIAGVDRATHLVEQLLLLSRLDMEEALDRPQAVDLQAIAEQVLDDLAPLSAGRRLEVHLSSVEEAVVSGDPAQLGVLMRNLLDNAIRYGPEAADVRVELGVIAQEVILAISDRGPGIPAGRRHELFQRFHRLGEALPTGSGLGLSIVRKIVELHRAQISFTDRPGGGLRVEVRFPRDAATA